MCHWNFSLP